MIRIAIVEDEKSEVEILKEYLSRFMKETGTEFEAQTFSDGKSFLFDYKKGFDIVLMDIEMPGIDGLETAKRLRAIDNRVVILFVTNMAQYAIKGYEVEAIDFAVKPLTYSDFVLKLNKAIRYTGKSKNTIISIEATDCMVNIDAIDIYYVEVMRHYLIYHTKKGDFTARGTLKDAEKRLKQYSFARTNHCYIVNLKYVEEVRGEELILSKKGGGVTLKISRSRKKEFLEDLARYIGGLM